MMVMMFLFGDVDCFCILVMVIIDDVDDDL